MKRLIVNADDFGFTRDVNAGIIEAHRRGILTATTLMANGAAFDDAVRLAEENPTLDVGCHLVLVQGESVAEPGRPLPAGGAELFRALAGERLPVYREFAAQIRRIRAAGICPTHLDTHKHTHLLPHVLAAVARLAQEFGIPWVRRPFDLPLAASRAGVPLGRRLLSRALTVASGGFYETLRAHGCRTTDHFAGFQITGRYRAAQLAALIRALPEGSTEFMCHPGRCGAELRAARTRLKESREAELEALMDPAVRQALQEAGVKLTSYRDLTQESC